MFRYSNWCDRADALVDTLRWFDQRGIPAGIVIRARYPQYSVWRSGVEVVAESAMSEPLEKWNRDYRIVAAVNGFDGREEVCRKTSSRSPGITGSTRQRTTGAAPAGVTA